MWFDWCLDTTSCFDCVVRLVPGHNFLLRLCGSSSAWTQLRAATVWFDWRLDTTSCFDCVVCLGPGHNFVRRLCGSTSAWTQLLAAAVVPGALPRPSTAPGRITQTERTRRWGRGGARDIARCGSLTAHFNFKNRCCLLSAMPI